MRYRSWVLLVTVSWLWPVSAWAQVRWSEEDIVRLARERAADIRVADALVGAAELREQATGVRPDPALSWEREALLGDGAASQDMVRVTVPVELSGRRDTQRLLARSASASARVDAAELRARAVEEALLAFYAALAEQQRVEILLQAVAELEEAARVLARREEAGMSAGYERDRLEIETELVRSRASEAQAELRARRMMLVYLVAGEAKEPPELVGSLATAEPAALDALARHALGARPDVSEVSRAVRAAEEAKDTASRAWRPGIALSGGVQIVHEPDRQYGYVAGLGLEIPVFSRGRELRAEAASQHRLAVARRQAMEQTIRRDVAEWHVRLLAARQEIQRFDQATHARVELLARAAASGYAEGHRTIVELLDAQRTRTEVRLRQLELAKVAKQAEIHLRRAMGDVQ